MKILVTGGAGYIGSHTCVELLNAGHKVIVVDNLVNSNFVALGRVENLTGKRLSFHCIDLNNYDRLLEVFKNYQPDAVIHFAALKAAGESVSNPLLYYSNNLVGAINLLECMKVVGCKQLVVSSSATVYGDPEYVPLNENCRLMPTNPYGQTKLVIEKMCSDLVKSESGWKIALLRYFNPIGAHISGQIGEDPRGIPNNLMPYLLQVAVGRLPYLTIHGGDWPTLDGTGIRDYIHVVDLALGHLAALDNLNNFEGATPINLGTGHGYSVLNLLTAMEKVSGKTISYKFCQRRAGDVATSYADVNKAHKFLNWKTIRTLDDMCTDSWRWQQQNPNGYGA